MIIRQGRSIELINGQMEIERTNLWLGDGARKYFSLKCHFLLFFHTFKIKQIKSTLSLCRLNKFKYSIFFFL